MCASVTLFLRTKTQALCMRWILAWNSPEDLNAEPIFGHVTSLNHASTCSMLLFSHIDHPGRIPPVPDNTICR